MSTNPYEPSREPAHAALLPGGTGLLQEGEVYSLGYDIFNEDLVTFSLFNARSSPVNRRNYYRNWILRTFALLMVYVFSMSFFSPRIDFTIPAIVIATIFLAFSVAYPWQYRRAMQRHIRQLINQESNKTICGAWRIVATPQRLSCYMPLVESHYQWQAIERIDRSADAIYAYVSAMSAVIVPARAFKSTAEMDTFQRMLTERNAASGQLQ